ncbi:hypothetical protein J8J04_02390 ['Fragaria x ananassa' phyllody phytoplasma]|uniref:Uncharacterized protein n=1 Tax='Fragaria x ananassa' phyllody phytoplasma TaxID=2358428 RepID=A0ABS5K5N7_9MOLU|nr:hypothetical protein ['Fragaria x ananassa' phyllody phytoplasma]MBS2126525.1 hypothetical protein ['Fragaria x ananassa' phyllody phytoplasma]
MKINNLKHYPKKVINFPLIVLISCFITLFSMHEAVNNGRKCCSLGLFSKQNTLLINVFLLLSLHHQFKKLKIYPYLSFICLMNCFVIIFFCLLFPEEKHIYFMEHKILTSAFLFYYFFIDDSLINIKKFYIGITYPLIYFLISLLIGRYNPDLYPYLEKMPDLFRSDTLKVFGLTMIFFIIVTIFLFLSFCMVNAKNKIIQQKYDIVYIQKCKNKFYQITFLMIFLCLLLQLICAVPFF